MRPVEFRFEDVSRRTPRYRVYTIRGGVETDAGVIELRRVPHLEHGGAQVHLWRATGHDGHRAFHEHSWQAALALAWDGTGYPFPFARPAWLTGTYP